MAVRLAATLTEAPKYGKSFPEPILDDSYKTRVEICPPLTLAKWSTQTPKQKHSHWTANMGTDRSKGTVITGGPRIQVRAFEEKRTWDGQKTETERAGNNPVLLALDCY